MGDIVDVQITKTDAYDLIGRVTEIRTPAASDLQPTASIPPPPVEKLTRISTGAALRVLG